MEFARLDHLLLLIREPYSVGFGKNDVLDAGLLAVGADLEFVAGHRTAQPQVLALPVSLPLGEDLPRLGAGPGAGEP